MSVKLEAWASESVGMQSSANGSRYRGERPRSIRQFKGFKTGHETVIDVTNEPAVEIGLPEVSFSIIREDRPMGALCGLVQGEVLLTDQSDSYICPPSGVVEVASFSVSSRGFRR